MSFAGIVAAAAQAIGTDLITFVPKRRIADFVAQVTIEEEHLDELTITQHPVEQGAAITDHAYKNPAVLTCTVGWSNSDLAAFGDNNYVQEIYNNLLELQNTRELFTVVTGKRTYQNMLIASLSTTTTNETENSLILRVSMREVILVQTQQTAVPATDVQKNPQQTASIQNSGTKQLTQAPNFDAGS